MTFWKKSTGETVSKQTAKASYEAPSNDLPPIPKGTLLKAMVTECKWAEHEGNRYINVRWDVIDGEYKKRVIFQKIRVCEQDEAKRDRAIDMLAAIDMNATGGKLLALGREPTDIDLMQNLCNKPMVIRVHVWELADKSKSGNWIDAISSAKKSKPEASAMVAAASAPAQAAAVQQEPPMDFDDDIPF